jgi:hypothetical protein
MMFKKLFTQKSARRAILMLSLIASAVLFQNCQGGYYTECADCVGGGDLSLEQLNQKINSTKALACNIDSDCTQIEFGSRPCGGPESWLVYSQMSTDVNALNDLVSEYNRLQDIENKSNNISGTCEYRMPYNSLACVSNSCVGRY